MTSIRIKKNIPNQLNLIALLDSQGEPVSEELKSKDLDKHGLKVGNYEYYNIGSTTLKQLKKAKIIPDKNYKGYELRKPDALLVDRRNKSKIKILCIVEYKDIKHFKTKNDKKLAIEEGNDLCQILNSNVGVATDTNSFIWFNPHQENKKNQYQDRTTKATRSYTIIKDEDGNDFIKPFLIDQKNHEVEITKLNSITRKTFENLEHIIESISSKNSQLTKEEIIDPTILATQIWQDVWSVTGKDPEKCLSTFVELFIFKYLSDLNILIKDVKGNKINFKDIFSLESNESFKNYTDNVRPYLRELFPPNPKDGTTIINGTVLNPDVAEHSIVFHKILKKFNDFGEMKKIDPSFKSKVFEAFMKESISTKNWGRYFTPRSVVDAVIEISDIDKLDEGAQICDPACGVGGFILEPIRVKKNGLHFYYQIEGNKVKSKYKFYGFDKGFEKEEQLIIILAKANMLIFLSELLRKNLNLSKEFADLFNSTFFLLTDSILGTLSKTESDKYDLIMTNPPYVTSGSSNYKDAIKNDSKLEDFYKINAMGVEGLFLEWIIRSLKPSKKAFVIIPDGILQRTNDEKIRAFLKDECILDAIISLPSKTFYNNQKKTYILGITKKSEKSESERRSHKQTEPVFTYLISDIGESLDVNRFPIPENDLNEMTSLFNQFKGSKNSFDTDNKRCQIKPIEEFDPAYHWLVDRWWSKDVKVELKIEEVDTIMTVDEFKESVVDLEEKLHRIKNQLIEFE